MINNALFTSNSDEWATPQDTFNKLNCEFNFDLDPCATADNHKTDLYFTAEQDGLKQNWGGTGYSVIHHIAKLINGLRKHIERADRIIQ